MKYGKIIILGTILASCAPAALADRLYGEIDTQGGKAIVTATGVTFGNANSAQGTTKVVTLAPKGSVIDGNSTQDFINFDGQAHGLGQTAGNGFQYITGSATTAQTLTFAAINAAGANNGVGIRLYTLIENGYTLRFFITSVDLSTVVASNTSKTATTPTGAFLGEGYITVTGGADPSKDTTKTIVDFGFSNTVGARGLNFTTDIIAPAPEPASLVLLGTGLLGMVGAGRKKLFKA